MLGPLCIAIKEDSLTEDCDAIVRGQLVSAQIFLMDKDNLSLTEPLVVCSYQIAPRRFR